MANLQILYWWWFYQLLVLLPARTAAGVVFWVKSMGERSEGGIPRLSSAILPLFQLSHFLSSARVLAMIFAPALLVISFLLDHWHCHRSAWASWRVFPTNPGPESQQKNFGSLYIDHPVHLCWSQLCFLVFGPRTLGGLPNQSRTLVHWPIGLFRHLLQPCNCMRTPCTNLPIVVKLGIFIIEMGVNYMVWGGLNHPLCRLFYAAPSSFEPQSHPITVNSVFPPTHQYSDEWICHHLSHHPDLCALYLITPWDVQSIN